MEALWHQTFMLESGTGNLTVEREKHEEVYPSCPADVSHISSHESYRMIHTLSFIVPTARLY